MIDDLDPRTRRRLQQVFIVGAVAFVGGIVLGGIARLLGGSEVPFIFGGFAVFMASLCLAAGIPFLVAHRDRLDGPPDPIGRRTVAFGLVSAAIMAAASFLPNTGAGANLAVGALLFMSLGGGLLVQRPLDVVALVSGSALGVALGGALQYGSPNGPSSIGAIVTGAFMVGLVAALVGGAVPLVGALRRRATQTVPWGSSGVPVQRADPLREADVLSSHLVRRAALEPAGPDAPPRDDRERSAIASAETGSLNRDDEGTAYIVLFFGFLGIAAGAVIGTVILATAIPPRIDLAQVGLNAVYSVLCLAGSASACPPSTRPPGLGAGLLWFAGLVIVSWTGGGLVTSAWEKVASLLVRPAKIGAQNAIDVVAAALAVLIPAAIAVYFIVSSPHLLGRAALLVVIGWVGTFAWDELRARRDGTHLVALARRSPGLTTSWSAGFRAEPETAKAGRSWIDRAATVTMFLFGGGVVGGTVMSIAAIGDHGSTVLAYSVLVGGPLMGVMWILEEALQPGRSRNARIGAGAVCVLLLALGAFDLISLIDGSWTSYLAVGFDP